MRKLPARSVLKQSANVLWLALLCTGALAHLQGCSSATDTPKDGGQPPPSGSSSDGGSVKPAVAPFPHGACNPAGQMDFEVGKDCYGGSTQPLCVQQRPNGCPLMCLWHADDPAGRRAYCTQPCSQEDSTSCPAGFECKNDLCTITNVCVRVKPPSLVPEEFNCDVSIPSPEAAVVGLKAEDNGLIYALTYGYYKGSKILVYGKDGTWSEIAQPNGQLLEVNKVGGKIFAYGRAASTIFVTRLSEGAAIKEDLPVDCGSSCPWVGVEAVFQTQDGRIRAALGNQSVYERSADGKWSKLDVTLGSARKLHPLAHYGLLGICKGPDDKDTYCTSEDGSGLRPLPLPRPGASIYGDSNTQGGSSPSDVWALESNTLFHFDGSSWLAEGVQEFSAFDTDVVLSAAPDRVAIYSWREQRPSLYRFNGSCWTATAKKTYRLDIDTGTGAFDRDGRFLFSSHGSLCISKSGFEPQAAPSP